MSVTPSVTAAPPGSSDAPNSFFVLINGEIECVHAVGASAVYCKYDFVFGPDWEIVKTSGEQTTLREAVSQLSSRSPGPDSAFSFNFPIDVLFRSTNPAGWPQLVVSAAELDRIGRDRVIGYGRTFLPAASGRFDRVVELFRPVPSSPVQWLISLVSARRVEFVDPRFVARPEGREATRVEEGGTMTVKLNVVVRNMEHFGYVSDARLSMDQSMVNRYS